MSKRLKRKTKKEIKKAGEKEAYEKLFIVFSEHADPDSKKLKRRLKKASKLLAPFLIKEKSTDK